MGVGRRDKTPETLHRRDKKIQRKLDQLSKDHPENTYEIMEHVNVNRNKEYKIIQIKRTSGRRHHKIKTGVKNVAPSPVL